MLAVASLLVLIRVPSLAEPMGADQALYSYIGERILHGGLPYVDAWDQKPPAIHYTYALLRLLWPSDAVVALADLAAAAAVAALLYGIGRVLESSATGAGAALIFLFLSNPAFTRLNGVRVRGQCETFIAVAIAGAIYFLARRRTDGWRDCAWAGLLFGAAFAFKYNAAVYAAAAVVVLAAARRLTLQRLTALVAGSAAVPLLLLGLLAGALVPLYDATITYNVRYSGETYAGPLHFLTYLLTFPVVRARTDALWTIGGAGCVVLLAYGVRRRISLVPVVWVAAGCLSMAINGSRGLPQYFVQIAPALALATAWAATLVGRDVRARLSPGVARLAIATALVVVAVAVWRVNQFPKLVEQTWYDTRYLLGAIPRDTYLERYEDERKYSAGAAAALGRLMAERAQPAESVYVFGFTAAAYVYADRVSASRFFWSRPVIAGFEEGSPGYGVAGTLADLERARPAVVALQKSDWAPDVTDSADFFLGTPALAGWLRANYEPASGPEGFDVWVRRR